MSPPTSTPSGWRKDYRDATEAPHPAVKERVWRSLEGRPRTRSTGARVALSLVAVAALAVLAFVWLRPRTVNHAAEGFAYAAASARFEADDRQLVLRSGRLEVSSWGTPIVVKAGSTRVDVESAVAVVEVAGEHVSVRVAEGTILIDGVPQTATAQSRAEAGALNALGVLEPSDARVLRAEAAAERASREHRWAEAKAALDVVAGSSSLRAESALLKRGELELRQLGDPAAALGSFDEGDARFPSGALAMERALSALEASVAQAQWTDVEARCDRFLARFPQSNRRAEVLTVRAAALHAQGRLSDACAAAAELATPPPFATKCQRP
jgi:hypothetical protein